MGMFTEHDSCDRCSDCLWADNAIKRIAQLEHTLIVSKNSFDKLIGWDARLEQTIPENIRSDNDCFEKWCNAIYDGVKALELIAECLKKD